MSIGLLAGARREVPAPDGIEVKYVTVTDSRGRTFVEVWTAHHVYSVNRDLICFQVVARHGRSDPAPHVVGARLAGGEAWSETAELTDICMPLPLPGTCAVFQLPQVTERSFRTSLVERVVVHLYLLSMTQSADPPVGTVRGVR
jgi:hypothetical protein